MFPGRNDPCPCGSGKKYKKCCQDRASASRLTLVPPLSDAAPFDDDPSAFTRETKWEAAWEMRRVQERIEPLIVEFGRGLLGREGLESALEEFTFGDETIQADGPEVQLFGPWLL
jgi:hypothetical protein